MARIASAAQFTRQAISFAMARVIWHAKALGPKLYPTLLNRVVLFVHKELQLTIQDGKEASAINSPFLIPVDIRAQAKEISVTSQFMRDSIVLACLSRIFSIRHLD